VGGSQKGLMLPPGLSFNALSPKALEASKSRGLARSFWDWAEMIGTNANGFFPYTPATNLLYGLREAIHMLEEEGPRERLRPPRPACGSHAPRVRAWNLEILCQEPAEYSSSLTAVMMPAGHDADRFRAVVLEHFDMSLARGSPSSRARFSASATWATFNDLSLMGTLAGVEMGLELAGVPCRKGGAQAAMDYLAEQARERSQARRAA
jgi:alanine-glyoxylate transaminase/serine-glyoxylate transaminase/serine-pyruvate transaminase